MNPHTKIKIKKVIPYVIMWLASGLLYTLLERGLLGNSLVYPSTGNVYDFNMSVVSVGLGTFMMGIIIGVLEVTVCKDLFKKRSFGVKILLKTLLYVVIIFLFLTVLSFLTNSFQLGLPFMDQQILSFFYQFVSSFAFWSIMIYAGVFMFLTFFVVEMTENIGVNVLQNFFTGKYQKPKVEKRIFMFLDMKSSTTIAEGLGHIAYYKLLNAYYDDMTNAIIETEGEIYQYVGDEIVVSWDMEEGIERLNCITCFFMIKERIQSKSESYLEDYGLVPEFKAGIHCGQVTTGEIGVLKKDILFTGDVLNTTARIQGLCNELESELLISEDLANQLSFDNRFESTMMGEFELRGKDKKVSLSSIKTAPSSAATEK